MAQSGFTLLFVTGWVKVDLRRTMTVGGVVMQGRGRHSQYVTSTYVQYSADGVNWNNAQVNGASVKSNPPFIMLITS